MHQSLYLAILVLLRNAAGLTRRDYRATVAWPGAAFYEELIERYPDAKVILTVRDPDRWYESTRSTIYNIQNVASSPVFSLAALFVPRLRHLRRAALMAADLVWKRTFDGRFEEREYAIEVFERWNEAVERRVSADKLLLYKGFSWHVLERGGKSTPKTTREGYAAWSRALR